MYNICTLKIITLNRSTLKRTCINGKIFMFVYWHTQKCKYQFSPSCKDLEESFLSLVLLTLKTRPLFVEGAVLCGGMVSIIPNLCTLDAVSIHPFLSWEQKISADILRCPLGARIVPSWKPLSAIIIKIQKRLLKLNLMGCF